MIQPDGGRLPEVLCGLPDPCTVPDDGTAPPAAGGLPALESALEYRFSDPALLRVALTLGSWTNEHGAEGWPSNACLEFYGDAVVGLVAADALWRRFPDLDEGTLTRLRASLVAEPGLAGAGRSLDLGAYLYLGRGDEKRGARDHPGTLADAVEAVFGAVFLDASTAGQAPFRVCCRLFERWFDAPLAALRPEASIDAKSRLQQWAQSEHKVTPTYTRSEAAPGSNPAARWQAQVELRFADGRVEVLGQGEGKSLRDAERQAAAAALKDLVVPRSG